MDRDTIHIWDDIKKVIIFSKDSLDHKLALACAANEIREIDPDIEFEVFNCTDRIKPDLPIENPVKDTITLFLGYIPSMSFLQRTIEMVEDKRVIYIDNDETEMRYLDNFEMAKGISGIRFPNFSVSVLTFWYFNYKMRYARCPKGSVVFCNKFDKIMELTDPMDVSKLMCDLPYAFKAVNKFTLNPFIDDSTVYGACLIYEARLRGSLKRVAFEKNMMSIIMMDIDPNDISDALVMSTTRRFSVIHNSYNGTLRKSEHLKVIALNSPKEDGRVFLERYEKYHIGITYVFNGNMWYRVWRLGLEPDKFINIRKIAEAYGGHGSENYGEFRTSGQLEVLPIK